MCEFGNLWASFWACKNVCEKIWQAKSLVMPHISRTRFGSWINHQATKKRERRIENREGTSNQQPEVLVEKCFTVAAWSTCIVDVVFTIYKYDGSLLKVSRHATTTTVSTATRCPSPKPPEPTPTPPRTLKRILKPTCSYVTHDWWSLWSSTNF